MAKSNQKLKLLYLAKIYLEDTDEDHGVSMAQIIEKLGSYGISAERKSIYADNKLLQEFGFAIEQLPTKPTTYALTERDFSQSELLLLADAVQSSKFLTKKKSNALIKSIKTLGSKYQALDLSKRIHVEGRIKMQNESVFYNLDAIQRAINAKQKIEFLYFRYDENKEKVLQREGSAYIETPVQMTYSDGCYYLIAFNDKYDDFTTYRIDRMMHVNISDQLATRNERIACFDISEYQSKAFGMYSGESAKATLLVKSDVMGAVIDRFGKDVTSFKIEDGLARVSVSVMASPTLFGWLAQFGNQVTIEKPKVLKNAYVDYLKGIVENYE